MSTGPVYYFQIVSIFCEDLHVVLDIGSDCVKEIDASHDSWATRLVFRRLDGLNEGPVDRSHVFGLFSQDGRCRLDVGSDCMKKEQPASHVSWATRLYIEPWDKLNRQTVNYGDVVHIISEDKRRCLDIGIYSMLKEQSADHDSWATRLKVRDGEAPAAPPATVPVESVYALSILADRVYHLQNNEYDQLDAPEVGYTCIRESIRSPSISNLFVCKMAVWQHSTNGNVVLAIKGTSLTNVNDIMNDIQMVLGGINSWAIVQPTINTALDLVKTYHVNMITGHSLGGYMTEIIATNNNIPGIGFCAPGTNGPVIGLGGKVTDGFHNVNFEHDVAGNVLAGVYTHVQWSVYVTLDGVHHSVSLMTDYFKNKQDVTNANIISHCSSGYLGYYI